MLRYHQQNKIWTRCPKAGHFVPKPTENGDRSRKLKNPVALELYSYWNRLKGPRTAPERGEIEPADIRNLLPDTFVLETDTLEGTSFRLAGTRTCALFGRDLKNADFLRLWSDNDADALENALGFLRNDTSAVTATWEGRTSRYHETAGELVMMPLYHDNKICRILGTLIASDTPYWLGTFPIVKLSLTGLTLIPVQEHSNPVYRPMPRTGTHPVHGENRPSRQIRHLSVFEGGRRTV